MRVAIVALLVATACGTAANAPGATSTNTVAPASLTPTHSAAPTVTAAPSPTPRANPTQGPGTYAGTALGYRIDLPAGWRRSACQSTRALARPPGSETFTVASIDEESGGDVGGAQQDVVVVHAEEAAGQTPMQWLQSGRLGLSLSTRFEPTTLDGREAARMLETEGGRATAYAVAARGLMYVLSRGHREPTAASEQAATELIRSFHVLTDAELAAARGTIATPSPAPARTAEEVAAALARGFAQKDTTVLAIVADPCLTHGVEQGGAGFASTSKVLGDIQRSFTNGFVATVQQGPLEDRSTANATVRGTWQDPGQPQKNVKFMLMAVGNTWYWSGWIDLQPVR